MNVRLSYSTIITAGVFYADQLRMNNYRIKLNIITASEDGDDHNIALDRIKYFLHNQLNSTVFINSSNLEQCRVLASAGVKITSLPEEPIDQIIGIMLHCKLNAIVENRLIIDEVEISSDLGENIVYYHVEEEPSGPFETVGWWKDPDAVHCDLNLFDNDKIVKLNYLGAGWRDLDLHWNDGPEIIINNDNKVVFADFVKDETK